MNKVLITGGAGFVGSNLTKELLNRGYNVTGVDNLQTGFLRNIEEFKDNKNYEFIKADMNKRSDVDMIFASKQPDYVYHYAASVGVKRTLDDPMEVLDDIKGIENVLDACKNTGVKRIFFSSSSEVYGEPVEIPQHEDNTPLNSRLPYAVVKNIGELFIKTYQKEFGLDYTIFRFFNTYGPKQNENFVISKFIKQALNKEPITIYGDGVQTRTFMYIDDNVKATANAIENKDTINNTYNVGSEKTITLRDLAETIKKEVGSKKQNKYLPPLKEGDMTRRMPDSLRMREDLFPGKLITLEDGLKRTIEHLKGKDEKVR